MTTTEAAARYDAGLLTFAELDAICSAQGLTVRNTLEGRIIAVGGQGLNRYTITLLTYRVVRPNAGIVSRHKTLRRAIESLDRQRCGARQQGGFCEDYIEYWSEGGAGWRVFHEPDHPTPAPGSDLGAHRL